jgi:hypothetical protein
MIVGALLPRGPPTLVIAVFNAAVSGSTDSFVRSPRCNGLSLNVRPVTGRPAPHAFDRPCRSVQPFPASSHLRLLKAPPVCGS